MITHQESLISVDDFARKTSCTPEKVLRELRAGNIVGRRIDNTWYVDQAELPATPDQTGMISRVTAIMLAAANTDSAKVLHAFKKRQRMPFKARAPEFGLDVERVAAEARHAANRARWFEFVIGLAAVAGLWLALAAPGSTGYDEYRGKSAFVYLLVAFFVIAMADFMQRQLALRRARECLAESAPPGSGTVSLAPARTQNVSISGGYSPFVGAGGDAGGWSFTINLLEPAKEGVKPEPVAARELYGETEQALHDLAIPEMAVRDEVYIDGRDVRSLGLLMPNGPYERPHEWLPEQLMENYVGHNDSLVRHYKVIRLQLWGGQIILSTLFRYVIISNTLYVEAKTLILAPLKKEFLDLQNIPSTLTARELLKSALGSMMFSTVVWIPVLVRFLAFIAGGFLETERRWRKLNAKEICLNQAYNYGWAQSIREEWSGRDYSRYFQMIDQDFYGKMVKETLLDSLLKSLERRDISTEGLKSASTKIYNEGIIISGGTVEAENISAGKKARASVQKAINAASEAAKPAEAARPQ
jgi:hypothetical protein